MAKRKNMDYKVVCIKIPVDQELPPEMENLTPEETFLLITIGTNAMVSIKKQLINKKNAEYIVKMKAELEEEYLKQLTEKDQTILSLEMQKEIERNVFAKFIETEKGQIERDALQQYNTIVELKKDELEKVKQELYEKKKEMERLRDEKEREINLQKDILREETMKKTLENEKYKNEIRELENKHNTEVKMILMENEKSIEKRHQEEMEKLKETMQKLEAERTRLGELIKHNEQTWELKVQYDVMNEKNKETEKRDLLTIENNALREKINNYTSEIQAKELSFEKLKNEMLMKQMDETKRNNIPANIGNDGEQIFYNLAKETFCDFDDFKIENVSKNGGHQGDFIMSFAKFDIMVDVKNYTCSVGSSERQKIKKDLEKCPHIKIAWLVSLQTKIDKFGKHPIMCEMVNNSCVFYVNSLLLKSDPQETLKSLWCSTETLFDVILNRKNESLEMEMIKKNEIRIYKICGEMMKSVKEGKQALNLLKTNNEKIEASLQEILKEGISDLRENATDDIVKWCNLKLIPAQNQKTSVSSMFEKFKTDCPDCNVSLDSFRLIVKTIYNVKSNSFKVISNISFIQPEN